MSGAQENDKEGEAPQEPVGKRIETTILIAKRRISKLYKYKELVAALANLLVRYVANSYRLLSTLVTIRGPVSMPTRSFGP